MAGAFLFGRSPGIHDDHRAQSLIVERRGHIRSRATQAAPASPQPNLRQVSSMVDQMTAVKNYGDAFTKQSCRYWTGKTNQVI